MNYLVVRKIDGIVTNVIVWDGISEYSVEGCELIPANDQPQGVWIGWALVDGQWEPPHIDSTVFYDQEGE